MAKSKLGLQKDVSRIFTGIQIPKKNAEGTDTHYTAPATTGKPVAAAAAPASVAKPAPVAPPAIVSSPEPVVTPKPVVQPSVPTVVTPDKFVSSPAAIAPPVAPARPVAPAIPTPSPKPFVIPEQPVSQGSKHAVYEPPKPIKTTYEPSVPQSGTTSVVNKQSKPEPVVRQPKDSPLLKIIEKVKTKLLSSKHGAPSPRQKMTLLLFPVLAIVLIVVAINALKKSPRAAANATKKATVAAAALDSKINWEIPAPIPNNLRDPTQFGATIRPGETNEGPVVKGIVYSEDNPCAVVGDRIVTVGDVVAGAKVEKINRDSVEFSMGDKKLTQKVSH
jgi:hypothetical protein